MDKQKIKEQEDKLKELAKKPVSDNAKKAIHKKIKGLNKPFTK